MKTREEEQQERELNQFNFALDQIKAGQNPTPFQPVEFKVVVLNDFVSCYQGPVLKTDSDVVKERRQQTRGYIAAISPMAFTDGVDGTGWPEPTPQVGDKVLFSRHAGQMYTHEGVTYRVMSDKDLVAVVNESEEVEQ